VIDAKGDCTVVYTVYTKDWKSEGCSIFGEYMYDNGLLELNPEKPKEVKEEQRIICLSNRLLELNPEKI
jgi:hypothetical protein